MELAASGVERSRAATGLFVVGGAAAAAAASSAAQLSKQYTRKAALQAAGP
jgi:hypothetical protein